MGSPLPLVQKSALYGDSLYLAHTILFENNMWYFRYFSLCKGNILFALPFLCEHRSGIISQMCGSFFHTFPVLKSRIMWGLPLCSPYYGTLDTFLYARKEIFLACFAFFVRKVR